MSEPIEDAMGTAPQGDSKAPLGTPAQPSAPPVPPPTPAAVAAAETRRITQGERVAILVIHGIGQQRPYETLDQFTRNLMKSLCGDSSKSWTIAPELDSVPDPTRVSKAWIRASYKLTPTSPPPFKSDPSKSIANVSLFEYYWAPITQNKITYTGSLLFLIRAGVTPFLYLASNISALAASEKKKRIPKIIGKELLRQVMLFLPLIAFFAVLLASLNSLTLESLLKIQIKAPLVVTLSLLVIRYLYLIASVLALKDSLTATTGWRKSKIWRTWLVIAVLVHIFAWPYLLAPAVNGIACAGTWLGHNLTFLPDLLGHWSEHLRVYAGTIGFSSAHSFKDKFATFILLDPSLASYARQLLLVGLAYVARSILINYIGDVAVYVNTNEFSTGYPVRTQIIEECSAALAAILLEKDEKGVHLYDEVLIAAHSLGTVIAYDTMNALLNAARTSSSISPKEFYVPGSKDAVKVTAADLKNLRGLLTFGSPLNKIFYFFREQGDSKLTLRNQTIDLASGFRLKPELTEATPPPRFNPTPEELWPDPTDALEHKFKWINAYSVEDPISGRLVFYRLDAEQLSLWYRWPFIAHLSYWEDPKLYAYFRKYLL